MAGIAEPYLRQREGMAKQRKRYGGRGNRNPDGRAYEGHLRPAATRPLPPDFREEYIRWGWDCQYHFGTNWRVMRRWIDEAGGEELIAARARFVRENGPNRLCKVKHVGGWTAETLTNRL